VLKENAGEEIKPHPNFRLFGTANGIGSQEGKHDAYAGVNKMNEAFMDRWHVITMPHIDAKTEMKILKDRVPLLLPKHAKRIVQFANMVRKGMENATITMGFSTRRCIQWAEKTAMYRNPMKGAKAVFLDKASPEDCEVLTTLIGTVFGGKRTRKGKGAVVDTATGNTVLAPKVKGKRGRPKGSKNKV
jgi:cobaltochelatase CobS